MNEQTIAITLDRADWISICKDLTRNIGKMVDIMPTARLLENVMANGIQASELEPRRDVTP